MPLRDRILAFVHDTCAEAIGRYMPGLRVPGYFAGHRINADYAIDLAYTLKFLHRAGYARVGKFAIAEVIRAVLRQIDGEKTETFYSYRTAETLLAFGGWEDNPLLEGFDAAGRENIARAVDSTHIYSQWDKPLGGRPNNYWGVLARCEHARERLGLLADRRIYEEALGHCRSLLTRNPVGFFDDSGSLSGRYDIYSTDMHLFLEPLWEQFDQKVLMHNLRQHVRLLETIALRNGAMVAWGRSVGALSVCMTAECGAMALRLGMAEDAQRMLRLVDHAATAFMTEWFADGLIDAHRYRMTMNYRGPFRLQQMTFDCLGKLAYAAEQIAETQDAKLKTQDGGEGALELFPERDAWVAFDGSGKAGVWMYRKGVLEFQLGVVDGNGADYVPALRGPGLFETPVDCGMLCGVPRVMVGGEEFTSAGLPVRVEKHAGGITLAYEGFVATGGGTRKVAGEGKSRLGGTRVVRYEVVGDEVRGSETWVFEEMPEAVYYALPETAKRKLAVAFECAQGHSSTAVSVEGMQFWRSFWGEMARVHQIDFAPAREVRFSWRATPALRVCHGPYDHDYNRAIYDAMPADAVEEIQRPNGMCPHEHMHVAKYAGDAEVIHLGWPEHAFRPHGLSEEEFMARWGAFAAGLRATGKKIAWTVHNRRPHGMPREQGVALYRLFTPIVDLAMHHSEWGMELMKGEYPFRADCRHIVVPHGHFGEQMAIGESREALEKAFGLGRCAIRLGVLGRYQKEKQIEMIVEAFHKAGKADQQLVLTAYHRPSEKAPEGRPVLPEDRRIVKLPRNDWMVREEIARHTKVCDVLVAAHTGDTYLTSGLVADAVGLGITMLVPDWAFFREIMGEGALYHDNTAAGLERAIAGLTVEKVELAKQASRGLYQRYDYRTLSPRILAAFRALARG